MSPLSSTEARSMCAHMEEKSVKGEENFESYRMESKMTEHLKNGNVAPVHEINASNVAGGSNPDGVVDSVSTPEIAAQTSAVDSFYDRLSKLFESSGLSLLFNFRGTRLDLYMLYKEVTERGGFCQVTKDGKWAEVASTLSSRTIVSMSPIQLQKLYAHFLYQFEQTYHYRTPARGAAASGHSSGIGENSSSSTRKRNHVNISPFLSIDLFNKDGPTTKPKCSDNSSQLPTGPPKKKLDLHTAPKKDRKKDPDAPLRTRSAYQLFLRKECDRLKKIHGETSASPNTRNMAMDAWRRLSATGRQPYVQESMEDKERFKREMNAYKEQKNVLRKTDGDYHVNMQFGPRNFFIPDESAAALASQLMKNGQTNESAAELTCQLMKNGQPNETASELTSRLMKNGQPNETTADLASQLMKTGQPTEDAFLQINWDNYCGSLDIPI